VRSGFVGRERELAFLREAWDAARRGESRVVGIEGEPGVGKTALLRRFVDGAGAPCVVWASGDEDEAALPGGVLAQIGQAVGRAWGADFDPVFVGRTLAEDLREYKGLILVVDDAHWADRPSMAAVRVAARQLAGDPVVVAVGYQPAPALDDRWRRLVESDRGLYVPLAGLPATELARFAVACGHPGLSPAGAARLHEHTGGHPLHVRHLLDELPMHAIVFGQGPLPAPRAAAAAIGARLAACPVGTRELLGIGAVIGRRFSLAQVWRVADAADPAGGDALADAIGAGLLEEVPGSGGGEFAFTSSLVREVVHQDLARARRRELHRRAAAAGTPGSVRHRLAAADGPDPALAADAEREAQSLLARGRVQLAAAYLRHALDLTPTGPDRRPRLLAAVETILAAGDVATSLRYRGELVAGSGPWCDYVDGYQLLVTGDVAGAGARLARALHAAGPPDPGQPPDLHARVATQLAIIAVLTVSYPDMIAHGAAAVATAREGWVAAFAWFARSLGLAVAGRGAEALADLAGAGAPGAPSGLDGLVARGMIRLWTDDLAGARHDLTAAVERATAGEAMRIGQALGFLGEVEYRRGALADAVLHTQLAIGDAEENDRVWDYAMLHALAAYPLAAQAEWERAESHARRSGDWAHRVGSPAGLVYAAAARAAIAQARADPAGLLRAADDLDASYPALEPGTHLVGPVRADALSRLGRADDGAAALAAFEAKVAHAGRRSTDLCVARVRAQLAAARGEHAEALRECQRAADPGLPLEAARIDLVAGASLSALGRRAAAERTLRAASERFTALGAVAYATQARTIADRAGLSIDAPADALACLTAAERAVAALVGQGLSNKEIAVRLVLSPKTVEFHLTNVFRRLDVPTRGELRRLVT
jgi:DNA-binding CsgD family transcriptional regulator